METKTAVETDADSRRLLRQREFALRLGMGRDPHGPVVVERQRRRIPHRRIHRCAKGCARHGRHAGERAVRQRQRAPGAALRRSRPRVPDRQLYGEDRQNGTPLQINDTTIRQLAFGTDYDSGQRRVCLRCASTAARRIISRRFRPSRANRDSESLTNLQHVPVQQMGMIGQWSKQLASRTLPAGRTRRDVCAGRQPRDHAISPEIRRHTFRMAERSRRWARFSKASVQITPKLVADACRPRRSVEQLRRQLHPHPGTRHRRPTSTIPTADRTRSIRECRCRIGSAIAWCCTLRAIARSARRRSTNSIAPSESATCRRWPTPFFAPSVSAAARPECELRC